MPTVLINLILLLLALVVALYACKILIDDARQGYSLTMGAEMYFSQLWLVASVLCCTGIVRFFGFPWWLAVPGVIALYFLSFPVRRLISHLFLGWDYVAPKTQGYKAFEQKIREKGKD